MLKKIKQLMLKKIGLKNDFTGMIDLLRLVYICISFSTREKRLFLVWLVTVNLAALACNMAAALLFYRGLGYYIEPEKIPIFLRSYYSVMSDGLILVVVVTPFMLLSLLGSILLRYSRVRLSRLVLDLRSSYSKNIKESFQIMSFQFVDDPIKNLDGAFGAMRALFLNGFVFVQFFVIVMFVSFVHVEASLVTLFVIAIFLLHLSLLSDVGIKASTSETLINDMSSDEVEDEGLGISTSKSFERLERMRHLGRMYQNVYLILVMLFLIIVSDDLANNLHKLLTFFILIRYLAQIFVPISVISGALVAPKKKIALFINFSTFMTALGEVNSNSNNTVMLLHSRSSGYKDYAITDIENIISSYGCKIKKLHVITSRFPDTTKITNEQINEYTQRIQNAKGRSVNGFKVLFTC